MPLTAAYFGRLRSSEDLFNRAVSTARRDNRKESAAAWQALEALTEAEYGRLKQARLSAVASQATAKNHDAEILAALALARTGDAVRVQSLVAALTEQYPTDTLLNNVWIPTIHAQFELTRGNATAVLRLLESAAPYDLGEAEPLPSLFPAFLRGEAYLQLHDGKSAAAEFQKVLDHQWYRASFPPRRPGAPRPGARPRSLRRRFRQPPVLSGVFRAVEERRPRHPRAAASQIRIRQTSLAREYGS